MLCKGSLKHCTFQLRKTPEEHIENILAVVDYANESGLEVNVYLEDWSNGMKDSPEYVFQLVDALINSEIKRYMLPDTLGILNPLQVIEYMSLERRNLLKAFGADIVLTDGMAGMAGSIAKARELNTEIPGSIILQQFENPANPKAHLLTTGEEIWDDTDGKVDVFVAGVGTGGTVCGVGRALKKHNPDIYIVAVEPEASPILEGGKPGTHRIQGIGANFIPAIYDPSVINEVFPVPDGEAIRGGRDLAATEGVLAGISSGAALYAARQIALRPEFADKQIVVLLPDTGERYLSTELFAFETYPLD